MGLHRLPNLLRLAAYALALTIVLYLCLTPAQGLPEVSMGDKAQHALTWAGLTLAGLVFWPHRPWRVAGFALAFGAAVEVLQGAMRLGRNADPADLAADAVGVAAVMAAYVLLRWRRRRAG